MRLHTWLFLTFSFDFGLSQDPLFDMVSNLSNGAGTGGDMVGTAVHFDVETLGGANNGFEGMGVPMVVPGLGLSPRENDVLLNVLKKEQRKESIIVVKPKEGFVHETTPTRRVHMPLARVHSVQNHASMFEGPLI